MSKQWKKINKITRKINNTIAENSFDSDDEEDEQSGGQADMSLLELNEEIVYASVKLNLHKAKSISDIVEYFDHYETLLDICNQAEKILVENQELKKTKYAIPSIVDMPMSCKMYNNQTRYLRKILSYVGFRVRRGKIYKGNRLRSDVLFYPIKLVNVILANYDKISAAEVFFFEYRYLRIISFSDDDCKEESYKGLYIFRPAIYSNDINFKSNLLLPVNGAVTFTVGDDVANASILKNIEASLYPIELRYEFYKNNLVLRSIIRKIDNKFRILERKRKPIIEFSDSELNDIVNIFVSSGEKLANTITSCKLITYDLSIGWTKKNGKYSYFPNLNTLNEYLSIQKDLSTENKGLLKKVDATAKTVEFWNIKGELEEQNYYDFLDLSLSDFDVYMLTAVIYSFTQHFFRKSGITSNFVLMINYDSKIYWGESVIYHTMLWANTLPNKQDNDDSRIQSLTRKYHHYSINELNSLQDAYFHDMPLVITDKKSEYKDLNQKSLNTLISLDAFPVLLQPKGAKNNIPDYFSVPINYLEDASENLTEINGANYEEQRNQLYKRYIMNLEDMANSKKMLATVKRAYKSAYKQLHIENEIVDFSLLNKLSCFLAALNIFKAFINKECTTQNIDFLVGNAKLIFQKQLYPKISTATSQDILNLLTRFLDSLNDTGRLRTIGSLGTQDALGWFDKRNRDILYLKYSDYYQAFIKYAKTEGVILPPNKLSFLKGYLVKNELVFKQYDNKERNNTRYDCRKRIVPGEEFNVLKLDYKKLHSMTK